MKKQVIIDGLTISELREVFFIAREKIGISCGDQIPVNILNFEYEIIKILFTKSEVKDE